jgi:hypothetical protein
MALQLGALRDALISAGAPPDKADKASEELAGYENRPASIETRLSVLSWMIVSHIAITFAIAGPVIWLLLRVASKVGAL